MKRVFLLLSFLSFGLIYAQDDNINKLLVNEYPEAKNYAVYGSVLRSIFNSEDNPESLQAIKNIEKIRYSKIKGLESPLAELNRIADLLEEQGLEEYIRVSSGSTALLPDIAAQITDGAGEIALHMEENEGKVIHCVMIAKYDDYLSVFDVVGSFEVGKLNQLDPSKMNGLIEALDFTDFVNFD